MNPFDGPPSSPPVAFDRPPGPPTEPVAPPAPAPGPEPRRGRMVVAVFATAGLLGAAAFGVSELAEADDDPALTTATGDDVDDVDAGDEPATSGDDTESVGADADDALEGTDDDAGSPVDEAPDRPHLEADGELRLDIGDGDPIIIDLDDIDAESLDEFTECIGLPDFDLDEGIPHLDQFLDGFDPEMFDQFLDGFDPEMFDQFLDGFDPEQLFDEFGGLDGVLEDLDPEQFDELLEDFDPEMFDQFFEDFDPEMFDEFFEGLDPEQVDPDGFEHDLGPLFESELFGDLFDQFSEGFDPEMFDEFFDGFDPEMFDQFFDGFDPEMFDQFFDGFDPEMFDEFFEGMPPFGEDFGEHEAGRRTLEDRVRPDATGGSWFPSGLDREQIESCLAELD